MRKRTLPPIIENRTTQVLVFCFGYTFFSVCILTHYFTSSNKEQQALINNAYSKIEAKTNQISALETEKTALLNNNTKLTETIQIKETDLNNQLTEENKKNKNLHQQVKKLEESNKSTAQQAMTLIKGIEQSDTLNEKSLTFWEQIITEHFTAETPISRRLHKTLAQKYYSLGDIKKTKFHLGKANNSAPELSKKLADSLNIQSTFDALQKLIKQDSQKSEITAKLKIADNLVNALKNNKEKVAEYKKYSTQLLQYQTNISLNAPPKEALFNLYQLIDQQKTVALTPKSSDLQKLNFLENCKIAFQLSSALNEKEKSDLFLKHIESISTLLSAETHAQQINDTLGYIALHNTDELFTNGSASKILTSISKLKSHIEKCSSRLKIVYTAAAAGHRAIVYREQDKTTNAKETLNEGIKPLLTYAQENPSDGFVNYRLGILYWKQAQLSTKSDFVLKNLKESKKALTNAISNYPMPLEKDILQFTAMVEGDLGHTYSKLSLNEDAKKAFSNALTYWQRNEKKWGSSAETKEGISYCNWRIKEL